MTFFNLIFLFLFSLVPLSIMSSQPPSINQSRNTSPVVTVRYSNDLWYDYPGSNNVYYKDPGLELSTAIPVPNKRSSLGSTRHSVPTSIEVEQRTKVSETVAETLLKAKPSSLPDESKLAQITALVSNSSLSQSTERFNLLRTEIAALRELLEKFLNQQPKGNPENPS